MGATQLHRAASLGAIAAVLILPALARAQDEEEPAGDDEELSDEEMKEIEEALGADAEDLDDLVPDEPATPGSKIAAAVQSLNPDLSLIFDAALAAFSDDDNLQAGAHDPTENGFNFQQLELAFGAAVDPYFRVDGNIVFSQFGVEVEEVYGTTLALPWSLQARLGQFLTRVGRINATHPHTWDFVDQTFMLGRIFGGEGNRGLGVELSWLTPLPWYVEIVGSITDASGEASARSFLGGSGFGVEGPLDFQASLMIEQFFALTDNWSLNTGISAVTGPNATGHDNRTDVWGVDLYLKYRPITRASYTEVGLTTEWLYRRTQVPRDLLWDVTGYASLYYRFRKRWAVAARYEMGTPSHGDEGEVADPFEPAWTDYRHRYAANVTFTPTEFSRFRLQGSVDDPQWRDDPIYAGFFAWELNIGAHGAHEF